MNKFTKYLVLAVVLATVTLSIYLYSQDFRPIIYKAAETAVADIVASTELDENEFSLLFCGTGSPNRTPDRGQPCTALVADGKLFLFDAGEGAIGKLIEYGAPMGRLQGIFLTHLHSDHISGVPEVLHNTWLFARRTPIDIIGPPGTSDMINGFRAAYRADMEERHRVLGAENLDPQLVFNGARDVLVTGESADLVYSSGDLSIRAFLVDHPDWPHAYGYRIEYKGKVVVISGDTRASDGIRRHAKGADILIHEALNSEIFNYIGEQMESRGGPMAKGRVALITKVHTPTLELANIAHEAGVRNLIITHLIPALPALWIADKFFIDGMEEIYAGNIIVARDGQWIEVSKL